MKKMFFFLLLLGIVISASAQQRLKNQCVINASGNYIFMDAWGARLGLERFLGTSYSSVHFNAIYNNLKYETNVDGEKAKSQMYLANVAYGYSLEKIVPTPFYVNFAMGALAGYEDVHATLKTSLTDVESKFVYGISGSTQVEYILHKKISLYLEPEILYFFNSDMEKVFFNVGLGIKFYL